MQWNRILRFGSFRLNGTFGINASVLALLFEISVVLDYCKKTRSQRFCRERQASSSRRYDIPVGDSPHAVTHHCSSNNTDSSNYSVLSHCLAHGLIQ